METNDLGPRPLDLRECAVIVDAFMIQSVNPKPNQTVVQLELRGNIADDVLDEDGIVKGLHGNKALILAL